MDAEMAEVDVRGALAGKTVLVLGGTGGVGEGVVRHLLDAGAKVIATSRDQGRADAFARRLNDPSLHAVAMDALAESFAADVRAVVEEHGPLDGVVVSIASWGDQGRKPLLALEDDEWDSLVAENQTAVFRAYRELYPKIVRGGVLVQLNGMSAEIPFPGAGGVALTAAATKSLTRTIAEETRGRGARVYEVILGVVRTRARQLEGIDDIRWIDAEEIGRHIGGLLSGESSFVDTVVHYFVDKRVGAQTQVPQL